MFYSELVCLQSVHKFCVNENSLKIFDVIGKGQASMDQNLSIVQMIP